MSEGTEQFSPIVEVDVDRDEALAANRDSWDDRARVHADSQAYNLDALVNDPNAISSVIAADLPILEAHLLAGSLDGLDVVHLQCHIGTDTLSLSRSGGQLTGVDFSGASLDVARDLAAAAGHDIRYVKSDVIRSAEVVGEVFDVVYTSIGTICWLPDLGRWAATIAQLLRPGGVFYFRDCHPTLASLDDMGETPFTVRTRYFGDGRTQSCENYGTYTDGDPSLIRHTRNYEWPHPISQTVQALLDAGLRLRFMGEGRTLPWQAMPQMVALGDDFVLPSPWDGRIPLTYTLIASKD